MGAIVPLEKDIIPIDRTQVHNPFMRTRDIDNEASLLFDEQSNFSYTKGTDTVNRLAAPTTNFNINASELGTPYYPYPVVVDLLKVHKVQEVYIELDKSGRSVTVYATDDPNLWTVADLVGSFDGVNTTLRLTCDLDRRYIVFTIDGGWIFGVEESLILGYPLDGERPDLPVITPVYDESQLPWDQVCGTNTFSNDDRGIQGALKAFRWYTRWYYNVNQYYQTYLGLNKHRENKTGVMSATIGSDIITVSDASFDDTYLENTIMVKGAGRNGTDWASEITEIISPTQVRVWNNAFTTVSNADGQLRAVNCNSDKSLEYMFEPTDSGFKYDTFVESVVSRGGRLLCCLYGDNRAQAHAWKIASDESSSYEFGAVPYDADGVIHNNSENDIYGRRDISAPSYTVTEADGTLVDLVDPFQFRTIAEHHFQFAARYGSTVVADNLLKLRAGQPRLSGLNQVHEYEIQNEFDAYWNGGYLFFPPPVMAAMMSAVYDGHKGALGEGYGIKTADPNAKVIIGGFAEEDQAIHYLWTMKKWWDANRGVGDYPLDGFNYHKYSNSTQTQVGDREPWSPEQDDVLGKAQHMRDIMATQLPGLPMFITEFGYDTQLDGPQYAPIIGLYDTYHTQAMWVIRSMFMYYAVGFQGVLHYMLRDAGTNPNDTYSKYSNSGFADGNFGAKMSWYAIKTVTTVLTGANFTNIEKHGGNTSHWIMSFNNGNVIKAFWNGTREDLRTQIQVSVPAGSLTAQQVRLEDLREDGNRSSLSIVNGEVTVEAREMPTFIIFSNDPLEIPVPVINVRAEDIDERHISIRWGNTNTLAQNIIVERKTEAGSYSPVATLEGGEAFYDDIDIQDGQGYYYRIKAVNDAGESPYSEEVFLRSKKASLSLEATLQIGFYRDEDLEESYPRPIDSWADFNVDQVGIADHTELNITPFNGSPSGINLNVIGATRGLIAGGQIDIGNFPKEIQRYSFFADSRDLVATFSGLDDSKYYTFEWLCNRAYKSSGYNAWVISDGVVFLKDFTSAGPFKCQTMKPVGGEIQFTFSELTEADNVLINGVIVSTYLEGVVNTPPNTIAKASVSQSGSYVNPLAVFDVTEEIYISGSESTDGEDNIESYSWLQVSGPASIIGSPNLSDSKVTLNGIGTYIYELTVTDDLGEYTTDTVTINVNAEPIILRSTGKMMM